MGRISNFWARLDGYLMQGLHPKKLALAIALGIVVGLFPIIGTTSIICLAISIPLRLNIGLIQLANYAVYPLQLLLFIPIIKLGNILFGTAPIPNLDFILDNGLEALKIFWMSCLYGAIAWLILSIPVFIALYYLLLFILKKRALSDH